MKPLQEGAYIKHFQYGLGVVTELDAERTSIYFDLHGVKKFVTSIVPHICSLKLRRELAAYGKHPAETRLDITDADLEDYRSAHSPRRAPSPFVRKPSEDH